MADFHSVRLPDDIERGAVGGPAFKTSRSLLASGQQTTVRHWLQPLGGWDIGYGIQSLDDLEAVRNFFYARMGAGFGFRFKDWSDFTVARQEIGTGDAAQSVFQMFKRYSDGTFDFDRTLTRLVATTVQTWVNSVPLTEGGGFSVDLDTGLITYVVTPAAGHLVEAACEFDNPCQFVKDDLNIDVQSFLNGSIPKIKIDIIRD